MRRKTQFPASFRVIGRSVVDWWDSWLDLMGVVVLWFAAQFTIVLGPPATFGLYYVAHSLINGESLGWRGLIEGGKRYYRKAWLWALINLIALVIFVTNEQFYGQIASIWAFYAQVLAIVLFLMWIIVQFYTIPFVMEMKDKSLFLAIRNGFYTGMASPFFSLLVILVAVIVIIFCAVAIIPIFFGVPALVAILGVRAMYNRLEVYGVREPDKSPIELEREQNSKIQVQGLNFPYKGKDKEKKKDF